MNDRVICIDLGSSYTKIGVRRGLNATAGIVEGLSVALKDISFAIPSVVAHEQGPDDGKWIIGRNAAELRRTATRSIYRNWKAALFRPSEPRSSSGSLRGTQLSGEQAEEVAIKMLRLLRVEMTDDRWNGASEFPARLCVPDFGTEEERDRLVRGLLKEAGWSPCKSRAAVTEPEANVIGIVTRGKNRTWVPPRSMGHPKRFMQMQEMLETGVKLAYRRMASNYDVLITDIGAYTIDFGYVAFDPSFEIDYGNHPAVQTASVALGVTILDTLVLNDLTRASQTAIRSMSTTTWERAKARLYAGQLFRFRPEPGAPEVILGEGKDRDAIDHAIMHFSKQVCVARSEFIKSIGARKINDELVTGGGSHIAKLREALKASCDHPMRDLLDPNEPERAVLEGSGLMSPREKAHRRTENERLVRTASAIGGTSVFFED